jgi:hypothetical protein
MYDGDNVAHVSSLCSKVIDPMISNGSVYCGQSPLSFSNRTTTIVLGGSKALPSAPAGAAAAAVPLPSVTINTTLPKSVQYKEFLPDLNSYQRVFLLDEEIFSWASTSPA